MITTFLATLNPLMTLLFCIAVGFAVHKAHLLPDNAGQVMAKLLTWVFYPALSFMTMARNCTVATLRTHGINMLLSAFCVGVALLIAIPLSRLFAKKGSYELGVYRYALAFANSGYMGDPLVLALFGDAGLAYYKFYSLFPCLVIYSWGVSQMIPAEHSKGSFLKKVMTPPTVAMLIGMVFGLTGLTRFLPTFFTGALDSLKSCMGPVAMLLAGFTVAAYSVPAMLKKKKVYVASVLRLTALPAVIVAALFGIKALANAAFGLGISNAVLFLSFVFCAMPLGLNTVVFPAAYGGDPETGASMTLISSALCLVSIPLLFALMVLLFGQVSFS